MSEERAKDPLNEIFYTDLPLQELTRDDEGCPAKARVCVMRDGKVLAFIEVNCKSEEDAEALGKWMYKAAISAVPDADAVSLQFGNQIFETSRFFKFEKGAVICGVAVS